MILKVLLAWILAHMLCQLPKVDTNINEIHKIQLLPSKTPITFMSTTSVSYSFGSTSNSDKGAESNDIIVSSNDQKENSLLLHCHARKLGSLKRFLETCGRRLLA